MPALERLQPPGAAGAVDRGALTFPKQQGSLCRRETAPVRAAMRRFDGAGVDSRDVVVGDVGVASQPQHHLVRSMVGRSIRGIACCISRRIACCISRRIASAVAVMVGRSRISEVARSCCSVLSFRASYPARPATPLKGVRRLARGSEVQKGSMQQTQQERKHNPAHTHTHTVVFRQKHATNTTRTHTHTQPSTQTRHIASDTEGIHDCGYHLWRS